MKNILYKFGVVALILSVFTIALSGNYVFAEEDSDTNAAALGTSISISPVSKVFKISGGSVYDDVLNVTNDGSETIKFEVYAAPYSYIYSEETETYTLAFSKENKYTQIVRWISVLDKNGNYVERPTFTAEPGKTVDIHYRVTTPESIPDGGQYAVLFAHTVSDSSDSGGIKTEASPGMVIYGRSDGESIITSEISDMKISQTIEKTSETGETPALMKHINASAKIKNTGNVDFTARGVLKITGIFGNVRYETPEDRGRISIIPETELALTDEWEGTPGFGIFKATWTVTAGNNTETTEMTIFLISPSVIIISIILLTIIIMCIIITIKKRKEHRSRFSV